MKHEHLNNIDVAAYQHYDETGDTVARMLICNTCDKLNAAKFCSECNCFAPLKVLVPFTECPLKKWGKIKSSDDKSN